MNNKKIFVKNINIEQAQYNNKWKVSDTRRKIFYIEFNDGSRWYPRDLEIEGIIKTKKEVFAHNINYPNIDNNEKEVK